MRIGIDIDDTICDSWNTIIPIISDYFKINEQEIRNSDKAYFEVLNCSLDEWYKFVREKFELLAPYFELKENAVNIINKLKEEGNKIIFVTARSNNGYSDPYKISYDYLTINNIKFDKLIVNGYDKGKICKQESIDLFIDDNINNCQNISSYGIDILLFDANFNRKCNDFKRVYNWNEVYEYIKNK